VARSSAATEIVHVTGMHVRGYSYLQ